MNLMNYTVLICFMKLFLMLCIYLCHLKLALKPFILFSCLSSFLYLLSKVQCCSCFLFIILYSFKECYIVSSQYLELLDLFGWNVEEFSLLMEIEQGRGCTCWQKKVYLNLELMGEILKIIRTIQRTGLIEDWGDKLKEKYK